jgi:hypothetical protein
MLRLIPHRLYAILVLEIKRNLLMYQTIIE